jgi:nucleotide-binding universal stress UspA family protein
LVSLRQAFRGSTETSEQPVWSRIIVPVTDLDNDLRVLQMVCRIALRQRIEVTLVYVVEVVQSMPLDAELPSEVARGEHALQASFDFIHRQVPDKRSTVNTELLQARSAGAAIVDEAIERNAGVVMLSARLQRKRGQLTVGETVDYVLRHAPCEVIVVRHEMPDWLVHALELDLE